MPRKRRLAILLGVLLLLSASRAPVGDEGDRPATGRLDLRLKAPRGEARIEGTWVYQPYDGTGPYTVTVRSTQGGFYEFEGFREDRARPILQADRADDRALYRGEVQEGFDACIPAGARFELLATAESLVFEPALPVSAPVHRALPGPCTEGLHYVLAARGRGDRVRLKPSSELVGVSREEASAHPGANRSGGPRGDQETPAPAASVALGAASAPEGTHVEVLGSLRDGNGRLWHRVSLLEFETGGRDRVDAGLQEPGSGPVMAEPGSGTEGGRRNGSKAGTGDARSEGEVHDSGPSVPRSTAGKNEPPSGYVSAENVVTRWECRLDRLRADEPLPPGQTAPR